MLKGISKTNFFRWSDPIQVLLRYVKKSKVVDLYSASS